MKVGSKLGMEIEDTVNVDGDLDILEGSEPIGRTFVARCDEAPSANSCQQRGLGELGIRSTVL